MCWNNSPLTLAKAVICLTFPWGLASTQGRAVMLLGDFKCKYRLEGSVLTADLHYLTSYCVRFQSRPVSQLNRGEVVSTHLSGIFVLLYLQRTKHHMVLKISKNFKHFPKSYKNTHFIQQIAKIQFHNFFRKELRILTQNPTKRNKFWEFLWMKSRIRNSQPSARIYLDSAGGILQESMDSHHITLYDKLKYLLESI